MRRFAGMLADHGPVRGLIGPRELPRLWSRHLLNCAAVARMLPDDGVLVDVGSGGGLPGIVLAAMRPGMDVVLVETMERRVTWLEEVVDALGLRNVRVLRGRAEELHEGVRADVVTARAVAPLDRLAGWTLPFLRPGGRLLAMKGRTAAEELAGARAALEAYGGGAAQILSVDVVPGIEPTTVVSVVRESERMPSKPVPKKGRRRR